MDDASRRRALRVIFVSLQLDLISFTFILPLFPQLLEFYRAVEHTDSSSLLRSILATLNAYKTAFHRPISDRYDVVLLGGALGSLFSFLQTLASPLIGRLSDRYGRRRALLCSLVGNILSVMLWVVATDFRTFLASRVVAGLSEGNVQLATAMATDISTEQQRGSTMALFGLCFSLAFTFGPMIGAAMAGFDMVRTNPFAAAAACSLFLIVVETVYVWTSLPETLPSQNLSIETSASRPSRTNSLLLLNSVHFIFIFFFSGMEFSLTFMTHDLFSYSASQNGRLLAMMGVLSSLILATVTRKLSPLRVVQVGVVACAVSLFALGRLDQERDLWLAAALLAITTGTVVTGMNGLCSFEVARTERGGKLGDHRAWGQLGRSLGPLTFCTLYWWAGRETAYTVGAAGMVGVATLVFGLLKPPSHVA